MLLLEEIGLIEQRENALPSVIGIGDDADIAIGGGERLAIRIDLAEIAGRPIGRIECLSDEVLEQHEAGKRLEHRHFDMLALARALLVHDRGQRAIAAR